MTLPASGSISTDQILAELRTANPSRNYPLSTLDADVLALAGRSGPPVKMPDDFWGKSVIPPTSPTLTAEVYGNQGSNNSSAGGTASCQLTSILRGGNTPYTRLWEFTNNPAGFTLSDPTAAMPLVRKTYSAGQNGSARATLKFTGKDGSSPQQQVVVSDVWADLSWGTPA